MADSDRVIHITDELLALGIGELDLSPRIISRLQTIGIDTVIKLMYCCAQLNRCDECSRETCSAEHKLMDIPQFGKVSIDCIFEALKEASQKIREGRPHGVDHRRDTRGFNE